MKHSRPLISLTSLALVSAALLACDQKPSAKEAPPIEAHEVATPSEQEDSAETSADPASLTDDQIRVAVAQRLLLHPVFTQDPISVSVKEGIVQLSGTPRTLAGKEAAKEITRATKGVRGIVDRLEVPRSDVSDDDLKRRVENALLIDSATEAYEMTVEVDSGVVTLTGQVDSWAERELASEVASEVVGVVDVTNQASLVAPPIRPDSEIQRDISARLANDVMVDAALIDVRVEEGVVVLDGIVGSAAERDRALSRAWVEGVARVNVDELDIQWWQRDRFEKRTIEIASDTELRDRVTTALEFDPRLDTEGIHTVVDDRKVTLLGVVPSLRERNLAEETARETLDVRSVRNALRVNPNADVDDEQLAERVERNIEWNALVDDFRGEVEVEHGHVVLDGTVDTEAQKIAALNAAERVLGVRSVTDQVDVYVEEIADLELEQEINDLLEWNVFVNERNVEVDVDRGIVTLTGEVDDLRAYRQAAMTARSLGAETVYNRLQVEST